MSDCYISFSKVTLVIVAQLVGAPSCRRKVCGFDSKSGCTSRFQVQSQLGHVQEGKHPMFLSHTDVSLSLSLFLSPPLPLSLNSMGKKCPQVRRKQSHQTISTICFHKLQYLNWSQLINAFDQSTLQGCTKIDRSLQNNINILTGFPGKYII